MSKISLEELASLAKRRGFIYQGSEVYGGLSGTWDYGPLGVALKRNIMNLWWKMFVDDRDDMFGVDAAILMNQKVWQASGHVDTFTDPVIECTNCNSKYRVDQILDDEKKYLSEIDKYFDNAVGAVSKFPELSKDYTDEQGDILGKIFGEGRSPAFNTRQDLVEYLESNRILAKKFQGIFPHNYLTHNKTTCEKCGKILWSEAGLFNMMFRTTVGPTGTYVEDSKANYARNISAEFYNDKDENTSNARMPYVSDVNTVSFYNKNSVSYLRPETAQGIFTNFKNVVDSLYPDLPFGIAQQGKAFRNEISPRDFVFRSREFEQMEIEYFIDPTTWEAEFEKWVKLVHEWCEVLGLPKDKLHELEVPEEDRAHYSKRTIDFEFDFPHGRKELLGLAYRTDFDLMNIQNSSGKSMDYIVKGSNEKLVPHVIEPSFGVERAIMAVLTSAYTEDEVNGEKRVFLKLPDHLAPIKFAVSPLLKNKPELVAKAKEVYNALKKKHGSVTWDDNGNIGKRYRRSDEIGVPKHITIDFDTLEDNTVTVRDRDTTEQKRVSIDELTK